jgi:hypothetical protein
MGNVSASISGAFVLSPSALIFIETNVAFSEYTVAFSGGTNPVPGAMIGVHATTGLLTALVTPSAAYEVSNNLPKSFEFLHKSFSIFLSRLTDGGPITCPREWS